MSYSILLDSCLSCSTHALPIRGRFSRDLCLFKRARKGPRFAFPPTVCHGISNNCSRVLLRFLKHPCRLSVEAVAAMVSIPSVYMFAIFADSLAQSALSSWIIHRESIQRWPISSPRQSVMASWKVLGKVDHTTFCVSAGRELFVNVRG